MSTHRFTLIRPTLPALLFAGVLAGCASHRPADLRDPLIIQVVVPDTGTMTAFGAQIRHGVQAAIEAANEGRAGKRPIKAEFVDDACETDRAVAVAKELVARHVQVVLGHVCSGGSVPASVVYGQAGIAMVSAASSSVSLTERGLGNVFRVALRADVYAEGAARTIVQRYSKARIAIIYETADISGRGHADQVTRLLGQSGLTPTMRRAMDGPSEASAVAQELLSQKIDVVFYGGHFPEQLGALLKATRRAGFTGQFVSNDGAANGRLWTASKGTAQGLLYTFGADLSATPEAADAVARIRKTGFEPEGFTLNAYAATEVIVRSLRLHPGDGPAFIESLHAQTVPTAIGPVAFDGKGDLREPRVAMYRWLDGKTVVDDQVLPESGR